MVPDIELVPFKDHSDQILINLRPNVGEIKAMPVILNDGDEELFARVRLAQQLDSEPNSPIEFKGDDEIDFYEIYRLTKKPKEYRDFDRNLHAIVDSEFYGTKNTRASATSFVDRIRPNTKYYYIFRAVDIHGNISNPTPLYEVEVIEQDGVIYHIIEAVQFERGQPQPKSREFSKFLRIAPTFIQKEVFITNHTDIDSATDAEVSLGGAEQKLFSNANASPKTYKFRITSKQSGKKADLNITFKHEHITQTDT
tara:strand:- start:479 stop:1240 length:762 start_codon:yes stop_codon:yes gene_type:complete